MHVAFDIPNVSFILRAQIKWLQPTSDSSTWWESECTDRWCRAIHFDVHRNCVGMNQLFFLLVIHFPHRFQIHGQVRVTTIRERYPMSHWILSKLIRWWTKMCRHSSANRFLFAPAQCKCCKSISPKSLQPTHCYIFLFLPHFSVIDSRKLWSMHKLKHLAVKPMTSYSSALVSEVE